jgi:hypothetical protein
MTCVEAIDPQGPLLEVSCIIIAQKNDTCRVARHPLKGEWAARRGRGDDWADHRPAYGG